MTARSRIIAALLLATVLATTPGLAHQGHSSPVPGQACEDKRQDDPCQFSNAAQDLYRGTCRAVGTQLLCVRNQPIVKGCADTLACSSPSTAPPASQASEAEELARALLRESTAQKYVYLF